MEMELYKKRSQRESFEEKSHPINLQEVVERLREESFEKGNESIYKNPRGFLLAPTITSEALESLGMLTFESSIFCHKDKLYFYTGTKGASVNVEDIRFHLHNHPSDFPGGFAVSLGDFNSSQTSDTQIDFIVTRDGLIGYKPDSSATYLTEDQKKNPLKELGVLLKFMLQNPNKTLRFQQENGISSFYVPFRGDAESEKRLGLICDYMNNPNSKWDDVKPYFDHN